MVKRGSLSKVEKYYIEGNANLPIEDIAKELDRTEGVIKKHLSKMDLMPAQVEDEPQAKEKDEPRLLKAMGRHERNGEKVATVMTKAASEISDETRPTRVMNKKLQESIHKPRG